MTNVTRSAAFACAYGRSEHGAAERLTGGGRVEAEPPTMIIVEPRPQQQLIYINDPSR